MRTIIIENKKLKKLPKQKIPDKIKTHFAHKKFIAENYDGNYKKPLSEKTMKNVGYDSLKLTEDQHGNFNWIIFDLNHENLQMSTVSTKDMEHDAIKDFAEKREISEKEANARMTRVSTDQVSYAIIKNKSWPFELGIIRKTLRN